MCIITMTKLAPPLPKYTEICICICWQITTFPDIRTQTARITKTTTVQLLNCLKTKVSASVLNITHRLINVSTRKTSLPARYRFVALSWSAVVSLSFHSCGCCSWNRRRCPSIKCGKCVTEAKMDWSQYSAVMQKIH